MITNPGFRVRLWQSFLKTPTSRYVVTLLGLVFVLPVLKARPVNETVAYFESADVPVLKFVMREENQDSLRDNPREYVRAAMYVNGQLQCRSVGIKLKGAAGSFREFDDTPGLTIKVERYRKDQRFHGMRKFHLNNGVQDGTLLHEWLGSELFRAAGYPAPRVKHARVWVNERDLGVYVFREGFDQPFLRRSFPDSRGNLYDGGFLRDIDSELEMDEGTDRNYREDLIGLAIACYQEDPAVRWKSIEQRLDIDQFLTFMAMERLCGHWDGYTLNINNYRLFFPTKGRAMFLPHGMDQLFGDPNAGLYNHAHPIVALSVMQNSTWRASYHERLKKLVALFQPMDRWHTKIDEMQKRLEPVLRSRDPQRAKDHQQQVQDLKRRLAERAKRAAEIVAAGPEKPMSLGLNEVMTMNKWNAAPDGDDVKLEKTTIDGVKCYKLALKKFGDHGCSWQRRLLLPRGEYRFEARLRTENVIPIPDNQGRGAGVRYSPLGRMEGFSGTTPWQKVNYTINIREDLREVDLNLELRARYGVAWFDQSSLKLQRIK